MIIRNARNFILLRIYKIIKLFKTGKFGKIKMTKKERTLSKIIKEVLQDPQSMVLYSPESYRVFAHNKSKTYIISFNDQEIKITNHKFFSNFDINPHFGKTLMGEAFSRIEKDLHQLESESVCNEDFFLNEVYDNLAEITKEPSENIKPNNQEDTEKQFFELVEQSKLI